MQPEEVTENFTKGVCFVIRNGKRPAEDQETHQVEYEVVNLLGQYSNTRTTGKITIVAHNKHHLAGSKELSGYEQQHEHFDKRLKAMEGKTSQEIVSIEELSLVKNLELPPKFVMQRFDKFNRIGNPLPHLKMFVRMMAGYTSNDNLLIRCFQTSLNESAKRWYNQLSRIDIQSREQLARAFLKQYELGLDMAPNHLSLQDLENKPSESFRQYAMRWKNSASEIQPPLTEREETLTFVNTLWSPYYEKLIMNVTFCFTDLILSGEEIENIVKNGRFDTSTSHDSEVQMIHNAELIFKSPSRLYSSSNPSSQYASMQGSAKKKSRRERHNQKCMFTAIPMSYAELYPKLVQDGLIIPKEAPMFNIKDNRLPVWYDPNAHYEYHGGFEGHSIEKCITVKKAVQELINSGKLSF